MTRFIGGGDALRPPGYSLYDEERTEHSRPVYGYVYHMRSPNYPYPAAQRRYFELWRHGGMSSDNCPMDSYDRSPDPFEMPMGGGYGKQAWYWVKGTVLDSAGAAVSGATVELYRSSDGLFISSTTSDPNGQYMALTPYSGVFHRVVVYKAGSPDTAGTSASNLTPTVS